MNINRHNYEELFLMYVDKELSEAQRAEVEAFVQQNPDLSEELALLQDAVLVPGDFVFERKEALYKNEHSININNYEEYFLLNVDNELNAAERSEVEKFVLQHPQLQDEFTLLYQTKLEAEVIEFKGKETLYRTDKKERRVIAMNFTRLAIAASVIGLIATLWIVYPGNNTSEQTIAYQEKPTTTQPRNNINQQSNINVHSQEAKTPATAENFVAAKKIRGSTIKSVNTNSPKLAEDRFAVNKIKELTNELLAYHNPKHEVAAEIGKPIENQNTETGLITQASNTDEKNASLIQPAVYKEANYDDDDEDKSFYIGSVELNKNKLRGLFKKASNLFDKKTKTIDSDKTLQIASFEIKTK